MQADLVLTEIAATKIVAGAFPTDAARANDLTYLNPLAPCPNAGAFVFLKEVNDV